MSQEVPSFQGKKQEGGRITLNIPLHRTRFPHFTFQMDRWTKKEKKGRRESWPCLLCFWQASLIWIRKNLLFYFPCYSWHLNSPDEKYSFKDCSSTGCQLIWVLYMMLFLRVWILHVLTIFFFCHYLHRNCTDHSQNTHNRQGWFTSERVKLKISKLIGLPALSRAQMKSGQYNFPPWSEAGTGSWSNHVNAMKIFAD